MNKLIQAFKAIYLRHPYLIILFISILLTLPGITMGEFYTKGEPREAAVATCILNTGNWILPADYADEVAYKPPFMHWIIAACSLPAGHVTETTARLPSALSLIGITIMFFTLLYKRTTLFRAAVASIILLTSFEMNRSGIEARVDMTLAFFMIAAMISLYKWQEKELKGYPLLIPVFLGGAALVKGPVGILLPCLVFGIYLLVLQRYSLWKIISKNIIIVLPALAILSVWYVLAYQKGGDHFLTMVYAENFARFLGEDTSKLGISYELGHEGPFWYYIPAIILGFLPWSFLLIFCLFTNSFKGLFQRIKPLRFTLWQKLANINKLTLFSLVSVLVILIFYAIPSSKRSVYIMPAYPFAAYLLTRLYEWALAQKPHLIKLLTRILLTFSGILLLMTGIFHFADLSNVVSPLIHDARTLHDVGIVSVAFQQTTVVGVLVWLLLLVTFVSCLIILKKKKTPAIILVATLILFIGIQVFLEGYIYPDYKDAYSSRPFAEKIEAKYDLQGKTYVMNNLKEYVNLYGLNFYMENNFKNFDKELPSEGYFLAGLNYMEKIREKYLLKYNFVELERTPNKYNDSRNVMVLYRIIKIGE